MAFILHNIKAIFDCWYAVKIFGNLSKYENKIQVFTVLKYFERAIHPYCNILPKFCHDDDESIKITLQKSLMNSCYVPWYLCFCLGNNHIVSSLGWLRPRSRSKQPSSKGFNLRTGWSRSRLRSEPHQD